MPIEMHLNEVNLFNFRNYTNRFFKFQPHINLIAGENGIGKTNLLESISMLGSSNGFRGNNSQDKINIQSKSSSYQLNYRISSELESHQISITAEHAQNQSISNTLINGKKTQHNKIQQYIKVMHFIPQNHTILIESRSKRLKYIDKLICNYNNKHNTYLHNLEKANKERSQMLRQGIQSPRWISALEKIISDQSIAIAAVRIDYVKRINTILYNHQSPMRIYNSGLAEEMLTEHKAQNAEQLMLEYLEQSRALDSKNISASIGAHKSDFGFFYLPANIDGRLCSTGEQKIILLELLLSNIDLHYEGLNTQSLIVLIDEFLTYLDKENREKLIKKIIKCNTQCFITASNDKIIETYKNKINLITI